MILKQLIQEPNPSFQAINFTIVRFANLYHFSNMSDCIIKEHVFTCHEDLHENWIVISRPHFRNLDTEAFFNAAS